MSFLFSRYYVFVVLGLGFVWIVSACSRAPSAESVHSAAAVQSSAPAFTEVTADAGLRAFKHKTGAFGEKWLPETMGSGAGFIDYNGDEWSDILLVGGGTFPSSADQNVQRLWLYRNNQDGTFTLQSQKAGLTAVDAYGMGVTVADYDNDGDQDFFLTALKEDKLFRNDGGRFTEVAESAGVEGASNWSTAATFFDANRDGDLDLYVGKYVVWSPEQDIWCSVDGEDKAYCAPTLYEGISGRFYYNNGDGTFREASKAAGMASAPGKTLGVTELDYNRDGWPDLAVANDLQRDLLYQNNGDGTFTERGMASGIAFSASGIARGGMGISAGVVDTTGEVSIFVGNFSHEMVGVYRHIKNGIFTDRAAVSKIGHKSLLTLTFGLILFDVDLDGDQDLLTANGHLQEHVDRVQNGVTYRQASQLYINQNNGRFQEWTQKAGGLLSRPMVARGAAYADYDRDGDLDVLITENKGPVHLWRNDTKGGGYLRVSLKGRKSSRDGVSSRIVALVGKQRLEQRIRTGASYLSQSEKVATFGLNGREQVDSLYVHWSGGTVERLGPVKGNQQIQIVEGEGIKRRDRSEPPLVVTDP